MNPTPTSNVKRDDGMATVLALGSVTGLALVVTATAAAGQWAMERARASMVADLAAVSAARHGSCAAAVSAAEAHGAGVSDCSWDGVDVTVTVTLRTSALLAAWRSRSDVRARARAGY